MVYKVQTALVNGPERPHSSIKIQLNYIKLLAQHYLTFNGPFYWSVECDPEHMREVTWLASTTERILLTQSFQSNFRKSKRPKALMEVKRLNSESLYAAARQLKWGFEGGEQLSGSRYVSRINLNSILGRSGCGEAGRSSETFRKSSFWFHYICLQHDHFSLKFTSLLNVKLFITWYFSEALTRRILMNLKHQLELFCSQLLNNYSFLHFLTD